MKSRFVFLFLLLAALPWKGLAVKDDSLKKAPEHVIEISSRLTVKGTPAKGYELYLSHEGQIIDTLSVEKSKPVYFELGHNHLYALVYRKEGFPDKIIMIDTSIPVSLAKSMYFSVDFEVELDADASTQKEEFLDYPVALISYSKKENDFIYSKKYHGHVHESDRNLKKSFSIK
jgi:hypothetical protein